MSLSKSPALCAALFVSLLLPRAILAQQPPPGDGPPPGSGPPGGPGSGRPPAMKLPTIRLREVEKAAREMFETADLDRDGMVTLDEVQAIIERRRDAVIAERFVALDSDGNRVIDYTEFVTWQLSLGARAAVDGGSRAFEMARLPDAVEVPSGNSDKARFLAMLLTPVSRSSVIEANINYDAGADLGEFLAFERRKFEAADEDGGGTLEGREVMLLMERRRPPEHCLVASLPPQSGEAGKGHQPPGEGPGDCGPPHR